MAELEKSTFCNPQCNHRSKQGSSVHATMMGWKGFREQDIHTDYSLTTVGKSYLYNGDIWQIAP